MTSHNTALLTLASALTLGLLLPNAHAATRYMTVNATGACQSSLPVFDVQIRKRPLAVQNEEGSKSAFVGCSYYNVGPYGLGTGIFSVFIYAATNDGVADTLTCTGINGYNTGGPIYATKTVDLPADGSQVLLNWNPVDFSDTESTFPFATFNMLCNLNPGVGINDGYIYFDDGL